jgi:Acidic fibroblast growth factor binding (FIBP)
MIERCTYAERICMHVVWAGKTRKDLDDVSEATRTPLKSCRRQFDNLRRVSTMLEEVITTQETQESS